MPRLQGILATTASFLVGDGDKLPWHHRGDLQRFFTLTRHQALLMGAPTFVGILKNYAADQREVLPGRELFVTHRLKYGGGLFEQVKVRVPVDRTKLITYSPIYDEDTLDRLNFALSQLEEPRILFVAGGVGVYDEYLEFCERIYVTEITLTRPVNPKRPYYLTRRTQDVLNDPSWTRTVIGQQEIDGVTATYVQLDRG